MLNLNHFILSTSLNVTKNINNYTKTMVKYFATNSNNIIENKRNDLAKNKHSAVEPTTSALTDSFGRHHSYLRISLTERCNLRCKYCMPSEGVTLQAKSQLLSLDEIYYLARIFAEQGVNKIRLTGGEPTIRREIVDIIANLKSIPELKYVGITTNGLVLTRLLVPMQRAGLDAINISLDTLKPDRYEHITRRKGWERVIAGIDLAIQLGYKPKINCVLMRDFNYNEICDFVAFTKDRNVDIRFIEYMPFMGNKWNTDGLVSYKETLEIIRKEWPDFKALENGVNDTSKAYKVPGFEGQVGFITSMTEHFCGTCNRLRLTADGNLKVCLFGNNEISLRDAIRNNITPDDLVALIQAAVFRKKAQHAEPCYKFYLSNEQFININNYNYNALGLGKRQQQQQLRAYGTATSNNLTHVDNTGKAQMVDVTTKDKTIREAEAMACVKVGPHITKLIYDNQIKKGDVLSVAQLAGIMGAKRTSELIPLCHNIKLTSIQVYAHLNIEEECVEIMAKVRCCEETGVEMEALTAVSVAALTIYDMCKAVSHNIKIEQIQLMRKTGGKHDYKNPLLIKSKS